MLACAEDIASIVGQQTACYELRQRPRGRAATLELTDEAEYEIVISIE
jgi:hypothetical protein